MALPRNATPVYTLTIPSTRKQVKYRPFVVKEEKALLIAYQSEDEMVMVDTIKSIIKECVTGDINVDALATFDVEFIFTQIRAKSVGEVVTLIFPCDDCDDEKARTPVSFDLTKISVDFPKDHSSKIELFEGVGIKLKYPDLSVINKIRGADQSDVDQVFDVIVDCIDFIYTAEEVFPAKDQTREELMEFIEQLTPDQFAKVQTFFETMPRIKQHVEYDCPVCNKHHSKHLEGIHSFF